jgi:glutamate-1-semialdehyde 2,1-aminomutase
VARTFTGRDEILMFDGKYHGHADELLGELGKDGVSPVGLGVPRDATRHVRLVQYNDLDAVWRGATLPASSPRRRSRTQA